jgi:hypothetical protein
MAKRQTTTLNKAIRLEMNETMNALLLRAFVKATPEVAKAGKRGTLVQSMERIVHDPWKGQFVEGSLNIPYDWAIFVHQGRTRVPYRKDRGVYVFWRNPNDDPRLKSTGGITPARRSQVKQLTPAQFRQAVKTRNDWVAAGNPPETSPVIITKVIRKPTPAKPFFSNRGKGGMVGFPEEGAKVIRQRFDPFVKQTIVGLGLTGSDEANAVL